MTRFQASFWMAVLLAGISTASLAQDDRSASAGPQAADTAPPAAQIAAPAESPPTLSLQLETHDMGTILASFWTDNCSALNTRQIETMGAGQQQVQVPAAKPTVAAAKAQGMHWVDLKDFLALGQKKEKEINASEVQLMANHVILGVYRDSLNPQTDAHFGFVAGPKGFVTKFPDHLESSGQHTAQAAFAYRQFSEEGDRFLKAFQNGGSLYKDTEDCWVNRHDLGRADGAFAEEINQTKKFLYMRFKFVESAARKATEIGAGDSQAMSAIRSALKRQSEVALGDIELCPMKVWTKAKGIFFRRPKLNTKADAQPKCGAERFAAYQKKAEEAFDRLVSSMKTSK